MIVDLTLHGERRAVIGADCAYLTDELVPAPRQSRDMTFAECAAQGRDRLRQIVVLDDGVGPYGLEQRLP